MDNPYASPAVSSTVPVSSQEVSAAVIAPLAATKGWARFLAVLGFIGAALMGLMGLVVMAMGSAMSRQGLPAWVGIIYVVIGLIYIIPAVKLNAYASRIAALLRNPNEASLVQALDTQRSFWKTVGIIALVTIAIYVLIFVGAMALALSTGIR